MIWEKDISTNIAFVLDKEPDKWSHARLSPSIDHKNDILKSDNWFFYKKVSLFSNLSIYETHKHKTSTEKKSSAINSLVEGLYQGCIPRYFVIIELEDNP